LNVEPLVWVVSGGGGGCGASVFLIFSFFLHITIVAWMDGWMDWWGYLGDKLLNSRYRRVGGYGDVLELEYIPEVAAVLPFDWLRCCCRGCRCIRLVVDGDRHA